jgi:hypothetical protein
LFSEKDGLQKIISVRDIKKINYYLQLSLETIFDVISKDGDIRTTRNKAGGKLRKTT